MRKVISIILIITLTISMCSGILWADEAVFEGEEVFEGETVEEETVFEEPANWDQEECMTEDSIFFDDEYVSEDASLAEKNEYVCDEQNEEVISFEDVAYEDENLLNDDPVLSEDVTVNEEVITEEPSFENVVDSGICGQSLTWKLTGEELNMTLTISGSGSMFDYDHYADDEAPWYEYRSDITGINKIIISEGVTSIGDAAFDSCISLTSITIPSSVKSIGDYAFYSCSSLTSIIIPNGVPSIGKSAFSWCHSLTSITIPNSVKSIGDYAFWDCNNLTSITIPNGMKSISDDAFGSCDSLSSITIPNSVTSIGSLAFFYSYNLTIYGEKGSYAESYAKENSIPFTIIEGGHEEGNEEFAFLTDDEVKRSGFEDYGQLVKGGKKILYVRYFNSLSGVSNKLSVSSDDTSKITVDSVEEMNYGIFTYGSEQYWKIIVSGKDTGETTVTAKLDSGKSIRKNVKVEKPASNPKSNQCGDNAYWEIKDKKLIISGKGEMWNYDSSVKTAPWNDQNHLIEVIEVEEGITSIGNYAFLACVNAKSVYVHNGLIRIGEGAFVSSGISRFISPISLKSIENDAFAQCFNLSYFAVGPNVVNIGSRAFANCNSLYTGLFSGDPPDISLDSFKGDSFTGYYPPNNANWTTGARQNYGGSITWNVWQYPHLITKEDSYEGYLGEYLTISGYYYSNYIPGLDADVVCDQEYLIVPNKKEDLIFDSITGTLDMAFSCRFFPKKTGDVSITLVIETVVGRIEMIIPIAIRDRRDETPTEFVKNNIPYSLDNTYNFQNIVDRLELKHYLKFFDPVQAHIFIKTNETKKHGLCYGMVCSAIASSEYNNPPITSYAGGLFNQHASKLLDIDKKWVSDATNIPAVDFIKYAYTFQARAEQSANRYENKLHGLQGLYNAVVDYLQNNGPVIHISIAEEGIGGHALLARGIGENNNDITEIIVYDCNHPKEEKKIILDKKNGLYVNWQYGPLGMSGLHDGSEISWTAPGEAFVSCYNNGLTQKADNYKYIISAPDSKYIVNTPDGKTTIISKDQAESNTLIPVVPESGEELGTNMLYYANFGDDFSITNSGSDTPIEIATPNSGIELDIPVNVTADVSIHEDSENRVHLGNASAQEYNVIFYDTNENGNDIDQCSIKGSSGSNITIQQKDEGIIIEGSNLGKITIENNNRTISYDVPENSKGIEFKDSVNGYTIDDLGTKDPDDTQAKISLDKSSVSLYSGESTTLKATVTGSSKTVTWSSSDSSVATVKDGKVTGIKAGTATITAEANGKKATCKVTVVNSNAIASGSCGENLTWKLTGEKGNMTLTISGSGEMDNYYVYTGDANNPWYRYRSSIIEVILPKELTSIGDAAFYDCTNLLNIIIPNSVTSLGAHSFYHCKSLTNILIPNSVTYIGDRVFSECISLKDVDLPSGIKRISNDAFLGCENLISIKIPNSVTSIEGWAFYDCKKLKNITIPNSVTKIGDNAFQNCFSLKSITIPNSVKSIGDWAFECCDNLTSIKIPDSVTKIGENVFQCCSSLTSIIIPNSISNISSQAFVSCNNLTSIKIPDSVTSIEKWAFLYCSSLTSIIIPDSVTSIDDSAFESCDKLTIYGYSGSYVEKYAKQNNIPFKVLGSEPSIKNSDISLNKTSVSLYTPKAAKTTSFTLKASTKSGKITSVSFKSSDTSVAAVNKSSGKVTSKKAGKATITATVKVKNGSDTVTVKLTCKVTVKKPTLTVTPTSVTLKKGKSKTLTVKTTPSATVTYTSSNKKIATVSNKGKITAKKKGSCKITVKCNGIRKTVKVIVQ